MFLYDGETPGAHVYRECPFLIILQIVPQFTWFCPDSVLPDVDMQPLHVTELNMISSSLKWWGRYIHIPMSRSIVLRRVLERLLEVTLLGCLIRSETSDLGDGLRFLVPHRREPLIAFPLRLYRAISTDTTLTVRLIVQKGCTWFNRTGHMIQTPIQRRSFTLQSIS